MEHSGSKEGCQFALRWVSRGFSFPGTTFNLKMFLKMSGRVYQLVISTILHVSKLFGLSAGFPLELVYPSSPQSASACAGQWDQPTMPTNSFFFFLVLASQVHFCLFKKYHSTFCLSTAKTLGSASHLFLKGPILPSLRITQRNNPSQNIQKHLMRWSIYLR